MAAPLRKNIHWSDHFFTRLKPRGHLFCDGWGDRRAFEVFFENARARAAPAEVEPHLKRVRSLGKGIAYEGWFESPVSFLPRESRRARIRFRLPADPAQGVCLFLSWHGETTWWMRRAVSWPLLREGVGAVMLETPYYGSRRPRNQTGYGLRSVSDLLWLSTAMVEEAITILAWLRREGYPVAVHGYSLGGFMAAYTAVRAPWPLHAMVGATGISAGLALARDLFTHQICWSALGSEAEARREVLGAFNAISLRHLPPPIDPERVWLLGCHQDGVIDPEDIRALHQHWSGASIEWLDSGHVAGYFQGIPRLYQAIQASFNASS